LFEPAQESEAVRLGEEIGQCRHGALHQHALRLSGLGGPLVPALLDAGGLAAQGTQVVELGPAHLAAAHDLDLVDVRRMQREDALDPDAARDLADGEGLPGAAPAAADDHPLEDLDTLFIALDDTHVDAHRVPGAELRMARSYVSALDLMQLIHGITSSGPP